MLSLAGRTRTPAPQPIPVRTGGFGGAAGLASWMRDHRTDALVDATHPFAARISANARLAAAACGVPLLHVVRPAWSQEPGDRWTAVATVADAAAALGGMPLRVLLTIGGTDLLPFHGGPHWLLVRTVDPPAHLPPGAMLMTARGPFDARAEEALIRAHGIDTLVTKNSGGSATEGKLAAARRLGVAVVMITRPPAPEGLCVPDVAEALMWLEHQAAPERTWLRGV